MTEQQTETEEAPDDTPSVAELDAKVDGLVDKIDRALAALTGGSQTAGEPVPEDTKSIAQREARAAVQDLQRREQAKARRDAEKNELEQLRKEKADKATEKPPKEYRRVERFMRWDKDEK